MAAKDSLQVFKTSRSEAVLTKPGASNRGRLRGFMRTLTGLVQGTSVPATVRRDTLCAAQTWVLSSAMGDVTATINGVDVTVSTAVSDTNTAGLMVAAINASSNALITGIAEADNRKGTVAFSSCPVGEVVTVCGIQFRAVAKQSNHRDEFEVSGNNTADGDTFTAKVNAHPVLQDVVRAINSSGTVTIASRRASTSALDLGIKATTMTTAAIAASATVLVSAVRKGVMGNCITLAASGTGATATAARLVGGTTATETWPVSS